MVEDTTIASNTALDGGGIAEPAGLAVALRPTRRCGTTARASTAAASTTRATPTPRSRTRRSPATHALVNGGGLFVDADGGLHVDQLDDHREPRPERQRRRQADRVRQLPRRVPSLGAIFRNSIVAGNRLSADCNAAWASEGGNLDGGTGCYFAGPRDRTNVDPQLDALADHGGADDDARAAPRQLRDRRRPQLASSCSSTGVDRRPARSTTSAASRRPKNGRCDVGAHEYDGPFPPPDDTPPQTKIADDNPTSTGEFAEVPLLRHRRRDRARRELTFECRILNQDAERAARARRPDRAARPARPRVHVVRLRQPLAR